MYPSSNGSGHYATNVEIRVRLPTGTPSFVAVAQRTERRSPKADIWVQVPTVTPCLPAWLEWYERLSYKQEDLGSTPSVGTNLSVVQW